MDILVEKLGPGVKNIQRAGWSSMGMRQVLHQHVHNGRTRVVLWDAQVDAPATELDVEAWNGLGWRGYLYELRAGITH